MIAAAAADPKAPSADRKELQKEKALPANGESLFLGETADVSRTSSHPWRRTA